MERYKSKIQADVSRISLGYSPATAHDGNLYFVPGVDTEKLATESTLSGFCLFWFADLEHYRIGGGECLKQYGY